MRAAAVGDARGHRSERTLDHEGSGGRAQQRAQHGGGAVGARARRRLGERGVDGRGDDLELGVAGGGARDGARALADGGGERRVGCDASELGDASGEAEREALGVRRDGGGAVRGREERERLESLEDRARLVVVGELVQQPRQHARRELRRRLQRADVRLDDVRLRDAVRVAGRRRELDREVVRQRVEDLGECDVERRRRRVGAAERELAQQPEEADEVARVLLGVEGAQRREQHPHARRRERGPPFLRERERERERRLALRLHERAHVDLLEQRERERLHERGVELVGVVNERVQPAEHGRRARVVVEPRREEGEDVVGRGLRERRICGLQVREDGGEVGGRREALGLVGGGELG